MKTIPRITADTRFPLESFKRCQICGFTDDDIVEFDMYTECDEDDKPEPGNIIIVCRRERSKKCHNVLDKHPRLYRQVPWGQGDPGWFMLLCGDCPFRQGTACAHPDLKKNGGEGLEILLRNSFNATLCYHVNETGGLHCVKWPVPAVRCAGHPTEGIER